MAKQKHFIGVDDYEISPTWKAPDRKRTSLTLGLLALYALRRQRAGKKGGGGSGWMGVKKGIDTRQRCTVKMHYSKSIEAHKEQINRYLVKEGKGKDGQSPDLYGIPEAEYRKNMATKNFRIFLSPASNNVPLDTLAKTFIATLERQTGYQLFWVAANHYDTANHHVHLLINGCDKNGKDVFFPPDLVKTFMRETARNLCTSLIGSRTKEDIAKEQKGLLTTNRHTLLDTKIKEQMINLAIVPNPIGRDAESIKTRLLHLQAVGLCTYQDGRFVFTPEWETLLQTGGRYNTLLTARKRLDHTDELNYMLYDGSHGTVSGLVSAVYKTDEVSDNHALVLEAINGNAYFIPLYLKPKVISGQKVEVVPEKNQQGRLTPTLTKTSYEKLYRECLQNDYRNGYAKYVRAIGKEQERNR